VILLASTSIADGLAYLIKSMTKSKRAIIFRSPKNQLALDFGNPTP
jgi:hypothetical protein